MCNGILKMGNEMNGWVWEKGDSEQSSAIIHLHINEIALS